MINENISLSIIFPTLNEGDNLKYLIPEFVNVLRGINFENYELIIIDDGSTDNTKEVVDELQKKETKLTFISRNSKPSLPLSIWEGIEKSKSEYVMWLDADGSMSAKDSLVLIKQQIKNVDSVIIGSRFVDGGAYKGTLLNEKNKLFNKFYLFRSKKTFPIYNNNHVNFTSFDILDKKYNKKKIISKLGNDKIIIYKK